jgi:hypothetical protein
MGSNWTLAHG